MADPTVSLTVRLVDRLSPLARRVADAVKRIGQSFKAAGGDAAGATPKFERFDKVLQRMAHASLAMQGLSRVAAGMRHRIGEVVVNTAEFDDVLQGIAQTTGLTADRQKELRRQILGVAEAYGNLPKDIAESTYGQFVQAGLSDDVATKLTGLSARVARATRASLKDIGNTAVALNQNLGILPEQMEDVFGGMHQAGKDGRFELRDMAAHFARSAALAQTFGMTGKKAAMEVAAAFEVARMATGDASQAATNVENLLQKMVAPQTVKKFGEFGVDIKKAIAEGQKAGVSPLETTIREVQKLINAGGGKLSKDDIFGSDRFVKLLRSHETVQKFKDYGINIGKKIEWGAKNGMPAEQVIKHWADKLLASARAKKTGLTFEKLFPDLPKSVAVVDLFQDQQVMLAVAALTQHFDEFVKIRDKAMSAGPGVIERDFAAMSDTTKASFDRLKAASQSLGLTWGNVLAPAASALASVIGGLTQRIRQLADAHPLLAKIGGYLGGAVTAIVSIAPSASNALIGLAASVALLRGTALGGAIGRVLGGIGRGLAAIVRLPTVGVLRVAALAVRGLIALIAGLAAALGGVPALVAAAVAAAVGGLAAIFIAYRGDMVAGFRDLGRRAAEALWSGIVSIGNGVQRLVRWLGLDQAEALVARARGLASQIAAAIGSLDISTGGAMRLVSWLGLDSPETVIARARALASRIGEAIGSIDLSEQGRGLMDKLLRGMQAVPVVGWAAALGQSFGETLASKIGESGIVERVHAIAQAVVDAFKGVDLAGVGGAIVDSLLKGLQVGAGLAERVHSIAQAVVDAFKRIDLVEVGGAIIDSLLKGLQGAAGRVEAWVSSWWAKIKGLFSSPFSFGTPSPPAQPQPQKQSAPAPAARPTPDRRAALDLIAPNVRLAQFTTAAEPAPTGGSVTRQGDHNASVTVHQTNHIRVADARDGAREIVRELERMRQANLYDGALA